jgi:hypothetical protein
MNIEQCFNNESINAIEHSCPSSLNQLKYWYCALGKRKCKAFFGET